MPFTPEDGRQGAETTSGTAEVLVPQLGAGASLGEVFDLADDPRSVQPDGGGVVAQQGDAGQAREPVLPQAIPVPLPGLVVILAVVLQADQPRVPAQPASLVVGALVFLVVARPGRLLARRPDRQPAAS